MRRRISHRLKPFTIGVPASRASRIRISTLGHRFPIEFSPSKRPLRIYVTEISPNITPPCHKPFHMYIRYSIYVCVCVCTRWWKSRGIFQARRNPISLRSMVKLALLERSMPINALLAVVRSMFRLLRISIEILENSRFSSDANLQDFRSLIPVQMN